MYRFVRKIKEKRLIAGSSDELDRMVRKHIGDVTLCLHEFAIYVEPLVVVRPLARKREPNGGKPGRGESSGAPMCHLPTKAVS